MKALIITAHGSRKKESNMEVAALAKRIFKKARRSFEAVEHAFLQLADPLLEDKINELVQKGVTKIVIFPFFIGSGSHILLDIPGLISKAEKIHPRVEFRLTRHLGRIEGIEDVILHEVITALN